MCEDKNDERPRVTPEMRDLKPFTRIAMQHGEVGEASTLLPKETLC